MSDPRPSAPLRLRILVAEDAPANQLLTARILQKHGHLPIVAADGQQAVAEWEKDGFDLILMDVQMPELDGLSAAAIIRRRESESGRPRTPIIGLTGGSEPADRERCLGAGMDGHLVKPIRPADLVGTVEHFVASARQALLDQPLASPLENAPFNAALLVDRLEGDIELVRRLIEAYRRDRPEFMGRTQAAIRNGDLGSLLFGAHRLHGLMRNFEAASAAAAAQELELAGRRADFALAAAVWSRLAVEVERLDAAVEAFDAELESSSRR
jgi:two-component system, sensor histidine kinase and response regulator